MPSTTAWAASAGSMAPVPSSEKASVVCCLAARANAAAALRNAVASTDELAPMPTAIVVAPLAAATACAEPTAASKPAAVSALRPTPRPVTASLAPSVATGMPIAVADAGAAAPTSIVKAARRSREGVVGLGMSPAPSTHVYWVRAHS